MDENGACPGCSGLPECGGCVHSTGGADVSDNRFDRLLSDSYEISGRITRVRVRRTFIPMALPSVPSISYS